MSDIEGTDSIVQAIARYRRAGLRGADLAEIEDHLRALVDDLRGTGMPAALAVTEAARRLGEPTALAREHARVRSPFGARLSRARAWSAAAPIVTMIVWGVLSRADRGNALLSPDVVLGGILVVALVARLSWARGVLLGGLTFALASMTLWLVMMSDKLDDQSSLLIWLGLTITAMVFLAPWRRGELTVAGTALALQVWAFQASLAALGLANDGPAILSIAWVTTVGSVLACSGIVLRARWSAVAAVASALALGVALFEVWAIDFAFPQGGVVRGIVVATLASGIACAMAAAVIAWRTARSRLGRLDAVLT